MLSGCGSVAVAVAYKGDASGSLLQSAYRGTPVVVVFAVGAEWRAMLLLLLLSEGGTLGRSRVGSFWSLVFYMALVGYRRSSLRFLPTSRFRPWSVC